MVMEGTKGGGSSIKNIFVLSFVAIQSEIKNYLGSTGQLGGSEARRRGEGKTIKKADLLLEALWQRFQGLPGAFTAFRSETEPGVRGGRRLGVRVRLMTIQAVCEYFMWENITSFGF